MTEGRPRIFEVPPIRFQAVEEERAHRLDRLMTCAMFAVKRLAGYAYVDTSLGSTGSSSSMKSKSDDESALGPTRVSGGLPDRQDTWPTQILCSACVQWQGRLQKLQPLPGAAPAISP
jgi:hypothetical protein